MKDDAVQAAMRRYQQVSAKWAEAGHPEAPCTGHTYPLSTCPAPEVHARLMRGADHVVKARRCPVDPGCGEITGWSSFLEHVYERHTSGTEAERQAQVQKHLERGPVESPATGRMECPPPPHTVVPKVTADERTHALWALTRGDRRRAREVVSAMGVSERRAFLATMTELINMLWGEG